MRLVLLLLCGMYVPIVAGSLFVKVGNKISCYGDNLTLWSPIAVGELDCFNAACGFSIGSKSVFIDIRKFPTNFPLYKIFFNDSMFGVTLVNVNSSIFDNTYEFVKGFAKSSHTAITPSEVFGELNG